MLCIIVIMLMVPQTLALCARMAQVVVQLGLSACLQSHSHMRDGCLAQTPWPLMPVALVRKCTAVIWSHYVTP